jgi:glutamate racemase
MWVPLVENNEYDGDGADYFIKKYIGQLLSQSKDIDTFLLACTHYPLLIDKIKTYLPAGITVVSQGEIVAKSLVKYLYGHPEMETNCTKNGHTVFFTTDGVEDFEQKATIFYGKPVTAEHLVL